MSPYFSEIHAGASESQRRRFLQAALATARLGSGEGISGDSKISSVAAVRRTPLSEAVRVFRDGFERGGVGNGCRLCAAALSCSVSFQRPRDCTVVEERTPPLFSRRILKASRGLYEQRGAFAGSAFVLSEERALRRAASRSPRGKLSGRDRDASCAALRFGLNPRCSFVLVLARRRF